MGYDQSHLDGMIQRQYPSLVEDLRKLESCEPHLLESTLELLLQPNSNPTQPAVQEDSETQLIDDHQPEYLIQKEDGVSVVHHYVADEELVLIHEQSDTVSMSGQSCEVGSFEHSAEEEFESVPEHSVSVSVSGKPEEVLVCEPDMLPDNVSLREQPVKESHLAYLNVSGEISGQIDNDSGLGVDSLQDPIFLHRQTDLIKELAEEKRMIQQKLLECEKEKEDLKHEIGMLQENNSTLVNTIGNLVFHEDSLRDNDAKVAYYTGLPSFALLMHIFGLVSKKVPDSPLYVLPKFQQFLLVLMRLRLNLQVQDLAFRFNVHVSTVSRIFYRWVVAMSYSLEQCILWPDRESLYTSMPLCFKREWGSSVAVIIDCFEVFTDRSSSLLARASTWSQYKHHNTVKFLIGITPQGTISYISPAYVGRTSDKHIVEDCGILNYLLPGDIVMADRGFKVEESVGFSGARLVIPAFTKGRSQLSYNDAETTRKIANVRIHVERLIGLVRNKYSVLRSILAYEYLIKRTGDEFALIDHVVRVCCALTNLCPPIVPLE